MDLVEIRIKGLVNTSRYGALSTGDVLRTDAAYARHLVVDCAAAEYIAATNPAPEKPARKPSRRKEQPK